MLKIKPNYYDNFKCLMGECPSSCCIMWQVVVDKDSLDYYNSLSAPYGDFIRKQIEEIEGEPCFRVNKGRCAFLSEDNLCNIHKKLGQEHLAATCRRFPDFIIKNNDTTLLGQSASCPYVAEQIIKQQNPLFVYEGLCCDEYENIFISLFENLLNAIDAENNFNDCTRIVLSMAENKQKQLFAEYGIEEFFIPEDNKNIYDYIDTLKSLSVLTEDWQNILNRLSEFEWKSSIKNGFTLYMKDRTGEYKNILRYFIYRYIMTFAGQGNVFLPIKFAVISTRILYNAGIMIYKKKGKLTKNHLIKLFYLFCKEIEHSRENLDIFFDDISLGMI